MKNGYWYAEIFILMIIYFCQFVTYPDQQKFYHVID